jgi:hypothetical protein
MIGGRGRQMKRWGRVAIGVLAAAASGGGAVLAHHNRQASCGNDDVLSAVHDILRDRFHVDHILMNGVQTISGNVLTGTYECRAQIADIRGNIDASAMNWRGVHYTSVSHDAGTPPEVTAELEGGMALAPHDPKPLWDRLFPFWSTGR